MAWFSGGLSQFSSLTDQISTFTKEVLTETTEEVEGWQWASASRLNTSTAHCFVMILLPSLLCSSWARSHLYSDPAAELQVARRRILELEKLNKRLQEEVCHSDKYTK